MKRELKPDFYYKYYIYAGGVKSAVEAFRFVLDAEIEEEKLHYAVERLLQRLPWLSLKPYITKEGRLNAYADAVGKPVYHDDGSQRFLGSKDTQGYLFYVSFKEHEIWLRIGHSLSDGRGMMLICQLLLYYYLEAQYGSIDDEGLLGADLKPDEAELCPLDDYAEAFTGSTINSSRPDSVLNIAGAREYLTTQQNKMIVMKTDLSEIKKTVKSFGTTPAVFLSAVLFEAVHDHIPSENGNVNLLLPVDLRGTLGGRGVMNFCGSMQIDDTELQQCTFDKQISGIKAQLEAKRQKDYQLGSFKALTSLLTLFDAFDLNDANAYKEQRKRNSWAGKDRCTLLFTNIGKIYIPGDIEKHIVSFNTYQVNTDYFPMLAMDVEKDKSRLILTQSSEDESFAKALIASLKRQGLEISKTETLYSGCVNVDPVYFERD